MQSHARSAQGTVGVEDEEIAANAQPREVALRASDCPCYARYEGFVTLLSALHETGSGARTRRTVEEQNGRMRECAALSLDASSVCGHALCAFDHDRLTGAWARQI